MTIKKGSLVQINECHHIPKLVGQVGEVVATEGDGSGVQYPLAVRLGEADYGFREDEVKVGKKT